MDQAKRNEFKEKLKREEEDLKQRLERMDDEGLGLSMGESIQELSSYDNHPADLGTEMFERGKDLALKDQSQIQLHKVQDAIDSMEKGTYGICSNCGQSIPEERLEAVPATTLCLACKEKEEELQDRHLRPIEEDVIAPPYGGFKEDEFSEAFQADEQIIYDGEDAWQEVARWNEHAEDAGAGSYSGSDEDWGEDRGAVEEIDAIPYTKDKDGLIVKDFGGPDTEDLGYDEL